MIAPDGTHQEYQERGDYHRHLDKSWRYYPVYMEKMHYVRDFIDSLDPATKILDLGCGEGLLVEEYHDKGYDVAGIDLNYQSKLVKKGSITQIAEDDEQFDLVMLLDVIEHLDFGAQEQAAREIVRVLKPGGQLLLTIPNLAHFASRFSFLLLGKLLRTSTIDRHPGDRPIAEYLRLFDGLGLTLEQRRGIFLTCPLLSVATLVSPGHALPLHRISNWAKPPADLCFLNLLVYRKST